MPWPIKNYAAVAVMIMGFVATFGFLFASIMWGGREERFQAAVGTMPPHSIEDWQAMKLTQKLIDELLAKKARKLQDAYDEENRLLGCTELTPKEIEKVLAKDGSARQFRPQVVSAKTEFENFCKAVAPFGFAAQRDHRKYLLTAIKSPNQAQETKRAAAAGSRARS